MNALSCVAVRQQFDDVAQAARLESLQQCVSQRSHSLRSVVGVENAEAACTAGATASANSMKKRRRNFASIIDLFMEKLRLPSIHVCVSLRVPVHRVQSVQTEFTFGFVPSVAAIFTPKSSHRRSSPFCQRH
jgi:hypothetical protein